MDRPHEKQCGRTGVEGPETPRLHGAPEVVADDGQTTARRAVAGFGIERHHQSPLRARVHVDGDVLGHDLLRERHELLCYPPEDVTRVGVRGIDVRQLDDEVRRPGHAALHGRAEEGLLRFEMPQHGRRGDAHGHGDVGQRGAIEALLAEDLPGRLKQLVSRDARWASHL